MDFIQFSAIFLGIVAIVFICVWWLVGLSMKRDRKKFEKERADDQLRLSKIKKYLDGLSHSVSEENKELIFKLKNRWQIIYQYIPYTCGGFMHPKLISAAADRDSIEVQLMDKGINIEYPD